jgi:hypothetical protein
MKKSFLLSALFVCAMCLGFTACGDDDDVDNGGKKQTAVDSRLYGTWQLVQITTQTYTDKTFTTKTDEAPKVEDVTNGIKFTLNSDGTASYSVYDESNNTWDTTKGKFTVDGQSIELSNDEGWWLAGNPIASGISYTTLTNNEMIDRKQLVSSTTGTTVENGTVYKEVITKYKKI